MDNSFLYRSKAMRPNTVDVEIMQREYDKNLAEHDSTGFASLSSRLASPMMAPKTKDSPSVANKYIRSVMAIATLSEYDLTLYHCHLTRSTRVKWAGIEMGISHMRIKNVQLRKGEQYEPEFRDQNPMSAVPALHLKHRTTGRELTMTESGAIVAFLVEQSGKLGPGSDILAKAQFHRFCTFATASMDALLWMIRTHEQLLPEPVRIQPVADGARKVFADKVVPTLEKVLGDGNQWLCAPYFDDFTAADLLVGYSLFWASMHGLLDESAILIRYLKRVMERKTFKEAFGERQDIEMHLRKAGVIDGEWLVKL